jgi:drug/metabolite transporter (DMT)-like permease
MVTIATAREANALKGALWMVGAALSLTAMAVVVRLLTPAYHVFELIFLRNLIGLLMLAPWIAGIGFASVRTARLPEHILRNTVHYAGMVAWFFAVTLVPLAELAALQFTMPIFAMMLAVVLLGETVGRRRWVAAAVGFAGALVIVRPGAAGIGAGALVVLLAALLYATSYVITKRLAATESGNAVVFWMNVIVLAVSAVPALLFWRTPAWADAPLLLLLGATGYATHYSLTRSFKLADVSFATLFDFLRLPFSAAFGYVLFAETPVVWTFAGAVLIFGAAWTVTWTEAARGRRRKA